MSAPVWDMGWQIYSRYREYFAASDYWDFSKETRGAG
jgi:hypothetical protein